MDFTREPVIQTVITPKEGCKLVVRSSKGLNQEEYFVDAVEVVAFGTAYFFRSIEKPKNFLLPVADYEILEVRETRMVLKHVGTDRSIKIGGGRESAPKPMREPMPAPERSMEMPQEGQIEEPAMAEGSYEGKPDTRIDKKRDRRRHSRRRRGGRDEGVEKEERIPEGVASEEAFTGESTNEEKIEIAPPTRQAPPEGSPPGGISSLLPPPPMLISETIARYREDALFKEAFYTRKSKEEEGGVGLTPPPDETLSAPPAAADEAPTSPTHTDDHLWNFSEEISNNQDKNS